MQELVARLSALDPEAGTVLKVITYFDKLIEGRVGLETLVRGAAVLSGFVAGVSDPDRHINVRVGPTGHPLPCDEDPQLDWVSMAVLEGGRGIAWLETTAHRDMDELILERLVVGVRAVLERTRRLVVRDDGAALEVMLDGAVTDDVRLVSARRLGWEKASRVRVVAVVPDNPADFPIRIGGVGAVVEPADAECADWPGGRVGIGEVVPVLEAWRSWEQALIALRFAGTETPNLPGPHVIRYSDLGIVAELARTFDAHTPVHPDIKRIKDAAATAPWLYQTLYYVLNNNSLRAASTAAHMHHSTLQDRVAQAERLLGWQITEPTGRFRLHLALTAHQLSCHRG